MEKKLISIDLVFEDWLKGQKRLADEDFETYIDITDADYHPGTTFKGVIFLDDDQHFELETLLAAGYTPVMQLHFAKEEKSVVSGASAKVKKVITS